MVNQNHEPPRYVIESLSTALRLLELVKQRRQLRVTDASKLLDVAPSTVHRMFATLAYHGYVEQDRGAKTYHVGRVLLEFGLGSIGTFDVRLRSRSALVKLAELVHETVNLIVLEGADVRFIDGVEGSQTLRVAVRTGLLLPAHATAGGKVLLASVPPDELTERMSRRLRKMTSRTMTVKADLRDELFHVAQQGYGLNRGESDDEVRAIAVPIRDGAHRVVAALAVSVPASRGSVPRLRAFLEPLLQSASEIEQSL